MTHPDATVLANATHNATHKIAAAPATAVNPNRRHRFVRSTLAVAAAFGLGLVLASGMQHLLHPQHPASPSIYALTASTHANNLASIAASTATHAYHPSARPAVQHAPPVAAPRLNTAIVLDGQLLHNPDQLVLPSDSVFALNLRSSHSGNAQVFAINPAGHASVLLSTYLQAGQSQRTPDLRVQGQRGVETLRIVFRPNTPLAGQHAATVLKQIRILHV